MSCNPTIVYTFIQYILHTRKYIQPIASHMPCYTHIHMQDTFHFGSSHNKHDVTIQFTLMLNKSIDLHFQHTASVSRQSHQCVAHCATDRSINSIDQRIGSFTHTSCCRVYGRCQPVVRPFGEYTSINIHTM